VTRAALAARVHRSPFTVWRSAFGVRKSPTEVTEVTEVFWVTEERSYAGSRRQITNEKSFPKVCVPNLRDLPAKLGDLLTTDFTDCTDYGIGLWPGRVDRSVSPPPVQRVMLRTANPCFVLSVKSVESVVDFPRFLPVVVWVGLIALCRRPGSAGDAQDGQPLFCLYL
jgi:hypothetical protein